MSHLALPSVSGMRPRVSETSFLKLLAGEVDVALGKSPRGFGLGTPRVSCGRGTERRGSCWCDPPIRQVSTTKMHGPLGTNASAAEETAVTSFFDLGVETSSWTPLGFCSAVADLYSGAQPDNRKEAREARRELKVARKLRHSRFKEASRRALVTLENEG
eukprot:CAMPEP_0194496378 /NCGR_PEP_ID=MMETSP0253-20130528/13672_1 /TAXON_ID=2966 /ORGANISM="Noctiluca scintillans" /LENGTH=159 /DNA_ID=CAMNT_0039337767 /DNA_START=22 /DNA_END=501 /DNA_ORIENTATION=-